MDDSTLPDQRDQPWPRRVSVHILNCFVLLVAVLLPACSRPGGAEIETVPFPPGAAASSFLQVPEGVALAQFQGPPPKGSIFYCAAGVISSGELTDLIALNKLQVDQVRTVRARGRCSNSFEELCDVGGKHQAFASSELLLVSCDYGGAQMIRIFKGGRSF
jgi:hypothetical protein